MPKKSVHTENPTRTHIRLHGAGESLSGPTAAKIQTTTRLFLLLQRFAARESQSVRGNLYSHSGLVERRMIITGTRAN